MNAPPPYIRREADGVVLHVRVQPRASRNAVIGRMGDALKVAVTAAPVEGQANAAVVALLAARLGIVRGRLEVIAGHAGRSKQVAVQGMTAEEVTRALEEAE